MSRLLVQYTRLFKSYDTAPLFDGISLSVNEGDRFALIGENGSGKTTLLQILAGKMDIDSGETVRAQGLTVRYLPQEVIINAESVRIYLEENVLTQLEKQMEACLEMQNIVDWEVLHDTYERLGGYQRIPIEKVLDGLKLQSTLLDSPVKTLSSGQKVRIGLAKAIMENPDLLLLDEPTNHLDAEMMVWLKEALLQRQGATVIVSHDRKFLNDACNHLIEIDSGRLTCYGGNYDFYLNEKERLLERQKRAYEEQKEEKAQLKQKIRAITFAKKKASPPKDQNIMAYDRRGEYHQKSIQRKLNELKTHLEEIELNPMANPKPKSVVGLKFASFPIATPIALELQGVSKSFGNQVLFSQLNKTVKNHDRVIITGSNGTGKTTLLNCIAGLLPFDEGQIYISPSARIAYLDQEVKSLPSDSTPLQYYGERYHLTEEALRSELHKAALGGGELLHRPFSKLSVGQRKRLMLLVLLLEKPNVLLLDEPTNHLDLMTLEALERALLDFDGAIIAVTHDSTFIEKIGNILWEF